MSSARARVAAVVALIALGVGGFWLGATRPPSPSPLAETPRAGPAPTEPGPDAASPREPTASSHEAPPPPLSAGAPPGCPEDEEDAPTFVRPSTWELLRERTMELRDRLPGLSRDASPELRAGLRSLEGETPDIDALRRAPDRTRDGFDVAVAALLHAGMRALARDDADAARALAAVAIREAPDDPTPQVLAALAASRLERASEARDALARAYARAPDEPALALAYARAEAELARFADAERAASAYLAAVPEDARVVSWRARLAHRAALVDGFSRRSGAGVEVAWPSAAIDRDRVDALIGVARTALDEAARRVDRARRPELTVVVYPDVEAMRRATCAPSWSGGIFDGVLHLDAATLGRAGWERVVRHEATHAQLALLRAPLPTWLNEGLAQEMEGAPSRSTLDSWRRMVARRFFIPFASLEGELIVIDDPDDARLAYHQSLAMVRFLLSRSGARALRDAADAVEARQSEDLLSRLVPGADGEALLAFLEAEL